MKYKGVPHLVLAVALSITSVTMCAASTPPDLKSPTNVLAIKFALDATGTPTYAVHRGNDAILLPSKLGFGPDWANGFSVVSTKLTHHAETWKPAYGERNLMPDNYNELTVNLAKGPQKLIIQLRAYDEGIAFRYGAPSGLKVDQELTEFHWPANTFGYEEHGGTEGEYDYAAISKIAPLCQSPLTVVLADGTYASVLEAANVNFPLMTLGAEQGADDTLIASLGGPGSVEPGRFTPWRLVMFARTPGELLEHNYLQLDLNDRQALKDASWIKPGTAMREVTLSTEGAHKTIDFAAAHGIQYMGFDWHWYGSEDYEKGDATHDRGSTDEKGQPVAPLDIHDVIRYGKAHGVGILVYIDRRQAKKQRDILFPLYESWGLKGVKIGFVAVGRQDDTSWITETVRKASEHHMMLDIHDQYRTTGYTRTYPNLLTVEGIRGNEHFPNAEHDATLPFTRYLGGSGDYTICYYDGRLKNTHAHQMAMAVVSYSPMQWLFWYDKPEYAHNEPELKWFEHLPTVWDETRVPLGEIGKYAVLARRSGNNWYVGAIGDSKGNDLTLPLNFLKPGLAYEATLYTDDPTVATATHIMVSKRTVTSKDKLPLALLSRGGEAIFLKPISKQL